MTAFITESEVKQLIDTDRSVAIFIDLAHLVISENLSGKGYSNDRLKMIELYLAAHFTAVTEEKGGLVSKRIGDASETYGLVKGEGFKQTRYGQQAIDLDTSGTLKTMNNTTLPAQFRVV